MDWLLNYCKVPHSNGSAFAGSQIPKPQGISEDTLGVLPWKRLVSWTVSGVTPERASGYPR